VNVSVPVRSASLLLGALLTLGAGLVGSEELPPPPKDYFNDYAGIIPPSDTQRLNDKLRRFDQETSNQILVAIFPSLPSASMEDFTIRTAQSWKAGREKLDNGVVLFVFVKERKMRMEVGYGLEGAVPDATANRIIEDVIVPAFKGGNYVAGLEAGIDAVIAATRGEYKAPPPRPRSQLSDAQYLVYLAIFIAFMIFANRGSQRTYWRRVYGRRGRPSYGWVGPWYTGGWGGGFSGGGGSFGGGGASGDW